MQNSVIDFDRRADDVLLVTAPALARSEARILQPFRVAHDLREAFEQVATDRMVSYFFSVDFDMLSASEQAIIRATAVRSPVSSQSLQDDCPGARDALEGALRRLQDLGYLRREENGYILANHFFRRWLVQYAGESESDDEAAATEGEAAAAAPATIGGRTGRGLFAELKRRNVFRVGVAYIISAWLLLQIGDVTFEFLEVPNWAGRLLIVFLVLGLPVALILAWAFELTPEGIRRDADVDHSAHAPTSSGRRLEYIIIAILAVAVAFFVFDKFL